MEPMNQKKLKIAAIGLNEQTEQLLDIAWESDLCEIAAVADERAERADTFARKYECQTFTDYRQLIIQTETDCLLFGSPIHLCAEFIRLGIQQKRHILKLCPPALDFEQLAEFYRSAQKEQVLFVTLQHSRFGLPFNNFRQIITKPEQEQAWHLISAVCHVPAGDIDPSMRWLNDPKTAGGGVLLQNCYDLIDELVLCFGLPQRLFALTINQAPDKQQRLSLTEDTALLSMQFADNLIAQLAASRTLGPARRHLRVHGQRQHITAAEDTVVIYDNAGARVSEQQYPDDSIPSKKRMLENLAQSLLDPKNHSLYPPFGSDLKTFAVIESAYLSNRTGMPEEPGRILNLAGFDGLAF
jgi:predicted dehydrogenase